MEGPRPLKARPLQYLLPIKIYQKHTAMKLGKFALCLLLVGGLSASCIKEDNSNCHNIYRLAFSYNGDGKTDIFPEKIGSVDMYVFDYNNNCVSSTRLNEADVEAQLTTLPPLDPGDYRIVCVGNAYETAVENINSKDFSNISFAALDYINGETVSGNDSLYWSATDYTIEPFSEYKAAQTKTTAFASSHYDILVEIVNAPEKIGKHPKIELVGVSPKTDFNNDVKGQATSYIMSSVHDGVKTTTASNNIMRHKNHEDVYLKVTGEDGTQVAMINFAEHIEKHKDYIDTELQECLIPFMIEFGTADYPIYKEDEMCFDLTITVPSWFIENITPDFDK